MLARLTAEHERDAAVRAREAAEQEASGAAEELAEAAGISIEAARERLRRRAATRARGTAAAAVAGDA